VLLPEECSYSLHDEVRHSPLNHRIVRVDAMTAAFSFEPAFVVHDFPDIVNLRKDDAGGIGHDNNSSQPMARLVFHAAVILLARETYSEEKRDYSQ
jgi:hypothetical protein